MELTLSAAEFKAKWLHIPTRPAGGEDGLVPRLAAEPWFDGLRRATRGDVTVVDGVDHPAPAAEGVMDAEFGILHR